MAGQLGRLHSTLEHLAGEVRAAVARAVGQATGEAVREALRVILDGPPARPGYHEPSDDREGSWGQPRRPTWPSTRSYEPVRRSAADEEPPAEGPNSPHTSVWSRAVATGCQAAAWWLRRHPGPFSLVAAAGIGIAAGVATLVSSPLVAGASAVAASALGVLALADAARCAAGLADQVMK